MVTIQLTVYFDDPFWTGVFERTANGTIQAAKVVFGAEPKDYEVYGALLKRYWELRFSPPVDGTKQKPAVKNPKRMQRAAAHSMAATGIGTKAQQALKLQHEQQKLERKTESKATRDAAAEQKFLQRQDRRKEKHKGH